MLLTKFNGLRTPRKTTQPVILCTSSAGQGRNKGEKVERWEKAPNLTPDLPYLGAFVSLQTVLPSEHVCEGGWMVFENQSGCDLKTTKPINIF